MSWVKLDDQIWTHRKMLSVEPIDRLLYVWALCWSSQNTTDGLVPPRALPVVAFAAGCTTPGEAADRLVEAGLWDLAPDGWLIHDYLDYQPSAVHTADVARKRAEAGRSGGRRSVQARNEANGKQNASAALGARLNPVPSRPVPSPSTSELTGSTPSSQGGSGGTTDDDEKLDQVLAAVGHRRYADALTAGKISSTSRTAKRGYRQACISDAASDQELRAQAAEVSAAHPDWAPEQVAEHLESDDSVPAAPQPAQPCPHCDLRHRPGPCALADIGGTA